MCSFEKHIRNIHNGLAVDSIAQKEFEDAGGKGPRPTMNPRKVTQTEEGVLWEF